MREVTIDETSDLFSVIAWFQDWKQKSGIEPFLHTLQYYDFPQTQELAIQLRIWLRKASANDALIFFDTFPFPVIAHIIAIHSRHWSPRLVEALVNRSPTVMIEIATNNFVEDSESIQRLFDYIVKFADPFHSLNESRVNAAGSALERLLKKREIVPDAWIQRLLPLIANVRCRTLVLKALSRVESLSNEHAEQIIAACNRNTEALATLVRGPSISLPLAKEILKQNSALKIRRAIAKRQEFLNDPEIRQTLNTSNCAIVLTALIKTAPTEEEAASLLERLSRSNPSRALEVIKFRIHAGLFVPATAIAATLSSRSPEVREEMVTLLSQAPAPATATEKLPRKPSRNTGRM